MSDLPAEPRTFESDDLLHALRRQLEAARSRLEEHRAQMTAAGLAWERPPAEPDPGA
jgi:hypothetical protein